MAHILDLKFSTKSITLFALATTTPEMQTKLAKPQIKANQYQLVVFGRRQAGGDYQYEEGD